MQHVWVFVGACIAVELGIGIYGKLTDAVGYTFQAAVTGAVLAIAYVLIAGFFQQYMATSRGRAVALTFMQMVVMGAVTPLLTPLCAIVMGDFLFETFAPELLDDIVTLVFLASAAACVVLPLHWRLVRLHKESVWLEVVVGCVCVGLGWLGYWLITYFGHPRSFGIA